jgi:hypothetical protein
MGIELWHRPWARLGLAGRDRQVLLTGMPDPASGHGGSIQLCTDIPGGPVVDGRRSTGRATHSLNDGRHVYAMPLPLHPSRGTTVDVGAHRVPLVFDAIPDRPNERLEPTTDRQCEAFALLDRVKAVWTRLREVETAIADPATIWTELTRRWLADDMSANPEMDIIVKQARELLAILEHLDRSPRRILRRTPEMIPLSRVQEIDRRGMIWLVRQPGDTMAERAGSRQRVYAITREENFNTLENRVLRSYAQLAAMIAREYVGKHPGAARSRRVVTVDKFGKRCRQLEADLAAVGVGEARADATPNFVLQADPNYRKVWDAWKVLLNTRHIVDELWRWQARSWEEFCALALVVALQSIPGAQVIATSPLEFQKEQEQGRWLRHVNPRAVFFLPEQNVTVEVQYGPPTGRILHMFGAPIWLRFGQIGDNTFLSRWAVWPIWHATGGLRPDDMRSIAQLRPHGQSERVRGGIAIRPVTPDADAQSVHTHEAACVTIGASASALRDGIGLLRELLVGTILRGAA